MPEDLVLRDGASNVIDRVDCSTGWFAGHNDGRVPMVRVDTSADGSLASNWTHNPRCGTATNSAAISRTCTLNVTHVGQSLDSPSTSTNASQPRRPPSTTPRWRTACWP